MRQFGLFTEVRNIYRKPVTMPRIGCSGEGIEDQRSASGAGEDHFVRALLVGNVATVAALCGRDEEALITLNRLAREPVSFVHLGKLLHAPEWDGLRANARFQKLVADAEAALKAQVRR